MKFMSKWMKRIFFVLAFFAVFSTFTLLEGLKVIQGGRWIWVSGSYLILYYLFFIRKPKIKFNAENEVKYNFGKKKE